MYLIVYGAVFSSLLAVGAQAQQQNDHFVPGREHARRYVAPHPFTGVAIAYDETPAEWPGVSRLTKGSRKKLKSHDIIGTRLLNGKGGEKGKQTTKGKKGSKDKQAKQETKSSRETPKKDLISGLDLSIAFRATIKQSGLYEHCEMFQSIADATGGIRAAGSLGYTKSMEYVAKRLENEGYDVYYTDVMADYFEEVSPARLEVIQSELMMVNFTTPPNDPSTYYTFPGTANGIVEAMVEAVDVSYENVETESTSGCQTEDFGNFTSGSIALLMRGTCSFFTKIDNAVSAGAVGIILTNSGTENNTDATGNRFRQNVNVPVIYGSSMLGTSLLQALAAGDLTVRITTDVIAEKRVNQNILAETQYGSPSQTIMIGAHLDSVFEGPGIQDNTSGSSAALEMALQLKKNGWDHPDILQNKIRFGWWAAEEIGLLGSTQYVSDLSEEERGEIVMYLNMDMIGSPNFVRFVLDGDSSNSEFEPMPQPGSPMAHIERTYLDYFEEVGLPVEQEPFSNSYMFTDHTPFYDIGIPVSDLHTGVDIEKTVEQAKIFGGVAGEPWDPCYHQACDTIDNVNFVVLEEMARAAAHALAIYGSKVGPVFL